MIKALSSGVTYLGNKFFGSNTIGTNGTITATPAGTITVAGTTTLLPPALTGVTTGAWPPGSYVTTPATGSYITIPSLVTTTGVTFQSGNLPTLYHWKICQSCGMSSLGRPNKCSSCLGKSLVALLKKIDVGNDLLLGLKELQLMHQGP